MFAVHASKMNTDLTQHHLSHWSKSLVQQRGKFILAIPVSCLVASLCAFGWLQFKTSKAEYWVQHTQQVRLEAKRLLTALLDAESGVRGYEIARRQDFLTPYDSEIAIVRESLKQLNQLVADNPSQAQRLQRIEELVQVRVTSLNRLKQFVSSQQQNVLRPPELVAQVLAGKQIMDRTKAEIEQFLTEEERLQSVRSKHLKQQQQLTWLVLSLCAGIGIGGSILAAYLLNRLSWKLTQRDRKLMESEARYRALIENFPNGVVFLFDPDLRYILADGTGLTTIGLSKEQLEGKTVWESLPQETCVALEPLYRSAIAGTASTAEIPYADRIFLVQALPIRNASGEVNAGMVVTQDITDRKQSEKQLYQLNRALRTISECNQALVRATEEATLLQDICQIVVECGSYCAAWIGFAEQDEEKSVRPVAQVGFEEGFLESLQIVWSDLERGRGPTGTAIRTGKVSIVQNILTDREYMPWREAAIKQGYASSIALPLLVDGQALGSLDIYAGEADAFDDAEVKLLTELANDLAYGITALRTQIERQQAEESLRDSEAQFRAFLESASEAIIITNANSEIVVFNYKAQELFGYELTEVAGRSVEFLMPQRYHQRHTEHRAGYRTHATKRSMSREKNLFARRKDGTEFPIEAGLSPIQTKDGLFVMTFLTDITERKRAEEEIKRLNESLERRARESETRYQQIVELAEEGIWVIDSEAKTTYVNHAMARMLGYTEEEMLGRSIFDFMNESARQTANGNSEWRKQGIAEKHEFKLKTKDGKDLWTYMSTSPVLDENGKLLWSCTLVYDITERKNADEQLRQSSERISLANAELARATRLKDEFLTSMSHELRTPLNAILGLAEALQEEVYGSLTLASKSHWLRSNKVAGTCWNSLTIFSTSRKLNPGKWSFKLTPSRCSLCANPA
jgi:PAS domain S-box-containing protein